MHIERVGNINETGGDINYKKMNDIIYEIKTKIKYLSWIFKNT